MTETESIVDTVVAGPAGAAPRPRTSDDPGDDERHEPVPGVDRGRYGSDGGAYGGHRRPGRSSRWTVTASPVCLPIVVRTAAVTGSLCVPSPSAMKELWNGWPSIVPGP
ncbi:hypothetical protein GCM10009629_02000 [Pseudonocardia alni]